MRYGKESPLLHFMFCLLRFKNVKIMLYLEILDFYNIGFLQARFETWVLGTLFKDRKQDLNVKGSNKFIL